MAQITTDAEQVAQTVTDFVNRAGQDNVRVCAQYLAAQHRTLQAYNTNLVMKFLAVMAEKTEEQTDARNEYAVKAAKAGYAAMVEALNGATRVPSC